MNGENLPEMNLNLPPGFLEVFSLQFFLFSFSSSFCLIKIKFLIQHYDDNSVNPKEKGSQNEDSFDESIREDKI